MAAATRGNRLRANRLIANGFSVQGNNFGIGLIASGTNDNVIVGNTVVGNANGITIVAGAEGNVVAGNLVISNPPVEVSVTQPATAGVDIRNLARPGANIFESNVCSTPVNAECSKADNPLLPR